MCRREVAAVAFEDEAIAARTLPVRQDGIDRAIDRADPLGPLIPDGDFFLRHHLTMPRDRPNCPAPRNTGSRRTPPDTPRKDMVLDLVRKRGLDGRCLFSSCPTSLVAFRAVCFGLLAAV